MTRRSRSGEVVTIYWRDLPAQVNGRRGGERHQILLSEKFQRAVDRAKRKAGIRTADAEVAQWRRTSRPCDGDVVAAAEARAAEIEQQYTSDYLGRLAFAGGLRADLGDDEVGDDDLAALEELDGSEPAGSDRADQSADFSQSAVSRRNR